MEYWLSDPLVTAVDGLLPDLAPYPQGIFTATGEITSEHKWPVSHIPSSLDGELGVQLAQIYQAQPHPDDVSTITTSTLKFQTPVIHSGNHYLDS